MADTWQAMVGVPMSVRQPREAELNVARGLPRKDARDRWGLANLPIWSRLRWDGPFASSASAESTAHAFVSEVRELSQRHSCFVGSVLSFESEMLGPSAGAPDGSSAGHLSRDSVILPPGVLESIEEHVIGIGKHREKLRASGQRLKRGLLLHGPPGTGKTHTVRYLVCGSLHDVTASGSGGALVRCERDAPCRSLQPTMVFGGRDLIAFKETWGRSSRSCFLLNEMDGLGDDVDTAFILTTNRADLLEPALAQRPGRIDKAVLIDLPAAEARRCLFDLYKGSLEMQDVNVDLVSRERKGRRLHSSRS